MDNGQLTMNVSAKPTGLDYLLCSTQAFPLRGDSPGGGNVSEADKRGALGGRAIARSDEVAAKRNHNCPNGCFASYTSSVTFGDSFPSRGSLAYCEAFFRNGATRTKLCPVRVTIHYHIYVTACRCMRRRLCRFRPSGRPPRLRRPIPVPEPAPSPPARRTCSGPSRPDRSPGGVWRPRRS